MTIIDEIKKSFKQGTILNKLIYINIGVFLTLHILVIFLVLGNQLTRDQSVMEILKYLAVPSDLETLARRPWTIFTYMFTHGQLYHILFNMLVLFWFGRFFINEFGISKVLPIYILGGIAGSVLYVVFFNIFPYFGDMRELSIATGASASVMAIVIAAATIVPNQKMNLLFIGPVRILYIALFLFITSTLLDFTDNTGGKIAHIGGAVIGYIFAVSYRKGNDFTLGMNKFFYSMGDMFKPRQNKKMKVKYKKAQPSRDDRQYKAQKADEQKEIDLILDKISKAGYDSLSKSEKEKLFNQKK